MRRVHARLAAAGACLLGLAAAAPAAAQTAWRLEQPPPPPPVAFPVPLGAVGDIEFWAPNRGLMAVGGDGAVQQGIYVYNGERWRLYSTVCAGSATTTRIAWAGPDEFWTITHPSAPRPRNEGQALCHFKGGRVVGSYSTVGEDDPRSDGDPYRRMTAAACSAPNDCWFGGEGAQDPLGQRVGAFHLHWNGAAVRTVYAPPGRGVSDMTPHGGRVYETTFVGRGEGDTLPPDLTVEDDPPRLIHSIEGGAFSSNPFVPATFQDGGSELLAAGSAGAQLWVGGGGSTSGPEADPGDPVDRGPLAARLVGGAFEEVPLAGPAFVPDARIVDIAPVPGSDTAWASVQSALGAQPGSVAEVALLGPDGLIESVTLPANLVGRGAADRIDCPAPDDCWMVTTTGWMFHLSDGSRPPVDTDPAFQGTVTVRPNEAAEQFIPDEPPVDDSLLFAPPPLEIIPERPPRTRERTKRLKPVLYAARVQVLGRTAVRVTFRLRRRARVGVVARRRGKVVARTPRRALRPGRHRVRVKLDPRRWPNRIGFSVVEPGRGGGGDDFGGGGGNTVTTP